MTTQHVHTLVEAADQLVASAEHRSPESKQIARAAYSLTRVMLGLAGSVPAAVDPEAPDSGRRTVQDAPADRISERLRRLADLQRRRASHLVVAAAMLDAAADAADDSAQAATENPACRQAGDDEAAAGADAE